MRMLSFVVAAFSALALSPSIGWSQPSPVTEKPAASTPAPVAGWQDGFFLQTPDGDYRLVIGYTGQMDGRFVVDDPQNAVTDTFLLRKVRPTFTGRIGRYFDFKVMPDLGSGQTVMADAYFDIRFSPKFRVRFGKDKSPVAYEVLIGDAFLIFPERSLASSLVPNRDVGVQAQGDLAGNRVFYAVGVMNGIPDGTSSSADLDANSGKDALGRVVVKSLAGFGVAVGGSVGRQTGALPAFRTSAGQEYFSYAGAAADGRRTRVTPSVFYYYKAFGGFGEYMRSSQWISKGPTRQRIMNHGWNVTGTWLLTGESATERAVRPRISFNPPAGQWGALQLVARYAELHVDRGAFTSGFAAAGSSREARSYTVGANWYPNQFVKFYGNFERTLFDSGATGSRKAEHLVLFRAQIAF